MSWLFEDPTRPLLIGAMVAAGLLIALFQTGRMLFGGLCALVAVMMVAVVVVEQLVVTEREEIENFLYHVAEVLETNDPARVSALIAPEALEMRMRTAYALATFELNEVKVTDVEPTINNLTQPATATVLFYARVNVIHRPSNTPYTRPVRFRLDLQRQGDQWLLTGYGHDQDYVQGNLEVE